jgi:hypothetical protein
MLSPPVCRFKMNRIRVKMPRYMMVPRTIISTMECVGTKISLHDSCNMLPSPNLKRPDAAYRCSYRTRTVSELREEWSRVEPLVDSSIVIVPGGSAPNPLARH